ncbi:xanthine dehydrogenase family protein molybdopterin-binding subunit [Larkinella soli]|uniref:xanthine dehydrogenase family protein molybdopterin-binding subunit n=1 Tax=Larkinella soli TaxID=1770527 RepID=UPI000FFBE723|nr:molybdopterin cofactor-binding domain-containing protein [Larkinella soli]
MRPNDSNPNRRDFLKMSALLSGWLTLSVDLPAAVSAARPGTPAGGFSPSLFVRFGPDGSVIFNLPKQEMGQGIGTGLAMVFADELGADLSRMTVAQADYNPQFGDVVQGVTGGSNSIRACWKPLREAAARVRALFITAAAGVWNAQPAGCYTENGFVIDRSTGRRLAFADLLDRAARLDLPATAPLKDPKEYRYIGKPVANHRTRSIVLGQARYGLDLELPGMLHAAVERCPVFLGKLKSVDDSAARRMPGVVAVVRISGLRKDIRLSPFEGDTATYPYTVAEGVAVVATSTWAAFQGKKALKIEWEGGPFGGVSDQTVQDQLSAARTETGKTVFEYGPVDRAFGEAGRVVEGTYDTGFQAHAMMEPLTAVADVRPDACELWAGHQYGRRVAGEVAAVLNRPTDQVRVHILPSGGAFGRRWEADFVVEAALISKEVGKPVKVTWTREDEIRHDYYHAAERDHHRVALDAAGKIRAWDLRRFTFDFFAGWSWNPYRYGIPAARMRAVLLPSPLQTGSWRSVGSHRETFARECFVDEMAHSLGRDPLAFRLELLAEPPVVPEGQANPADWLAKAEYDRRKTRRLLERVAEVSGWLPLGSHPARGMGVAVTNYCAQVVQVERAGENLRVKKVVAVIDCGMVINPSLVKGQVEGGIIWGLQAVWYGGIRLQEGRVQQSNFHDYRMIRMHEAPEIEVHLIDSDEPPSGAGEPGVPALAPAFSNAVFALTGVRIRSLPMDSPGLMTGRKS